MTSFTSSILSKSATSLLTLLICAPAIAEHPAPQLHGFINQGLIKTSDNSYFGDSEDYSFEFTDIALGASWRPHSKLLIAAQGIYRQAGATSLDRPYLDYALVDATLFQSMDSQLGARAGRIKIPLGFYNDTRDLASSRPSILLPDSVYRNALRDAFHTADGLSLHGHTYLGEHLLQLELLHGEPIIRDATKQEFSVVQGQPIGEPDIRDSGIDSARILLESFGGKLRLAYSRAEIDADFITAPITLPIPMPPFTINVPSIDGSLEINANTWSAEINWDKWQLTAEHQSFEMTLIDFFGPGTKTSTTGIGYYLSVAYQLNSQWRTYVRYDTHYADEKDKDGSDYAADTGSLDHNRYTFDTTLGIRYEHDSHWMFAAEIHDIKGSSMLSLTENELNQTKEDWTMFALQASYKF
jgi:hypothetical protein